MCSERKKIETLRAAAEDANAASEVAVKKQQALERALHGAGERLKSTKREHAAATRRAEARVAEAETALRDARERACASEAESSKYRAVAREAAKRRAAAKADAAAARAESSDLGARLAAAEAAAAAAAAAAALASERDAEAHEETRDVRVRELRDALAAALQAKAAAEERLEKDVAALARDVSALKCAKTEAEEEEAEAREEEEAEENVFPSTPVLAPSPAPSLAAAEALEAMKGASARRSRLWGALRRSRL